MTDQAEMRRELSKLIEECDTGAIKPIEPATKAEFIDYVQGKSDHITNVDIRYVDNPGERSYDAAMATRGGAC